MLLYQIGDWRNAIVASSIGDQSFSTSRNARLQSAMLSNVSGSFPFADPHRPVLSAGEYTVKGTLISGLNGAETVDQQLSYLMSLIGVPYMPIIVMVPSGSFNSLAPTDDDHRVKDRWLITYGTVKDVSRSSELSGKGEIISLEATGVSVSIEAGPFWEPVDSIRWSWSPNRRYESPFYQTVATMPAPVHAMPDGLSLDEALNPTNLFSGFSQILFDTSVYGISPMIDPGNWVRAYGQSANTPYEVVRAALPTRDPDDAIMDLDGGIRSHVVYADPTLWSASPRSMYYFSNFAIAGASLAITVTHKAANGVYSSTASLSIDDLYSILDDLGEEPLTTTDRLLCGHLGTPGGILLRDNGSGFWEPINVFIPWRYNGRYPGETFHGYNEVVVQGPAVVQYSYAHIFRTL